ncbi:MAG: biotin/lipoyl-binding protein [Planctomycetes bacterium]|nr:biotin/lipoyl-binding protein [Planctomycetota bacterium]
MKYHVLIEDDHHEVSVEREGGGYRVRLGDESWLVDVAKLEDGAAYSLLLDRRSVDVSVDERGDALALMVSGRRYDTEVLGEREWLARSIQAADDVGETVVRAVMTGIVNQVLVQPGDAVTKGQVLFILEAMKMENEAKAGADGTVSKVHVAAGATVNLGDVIVELA